MMKDQRELLYDDSFTPGKMNQIFPATMRLEPKSNKESPEVEITNDEERREKGKIVKESRSTPFSTPIRSPRIHTDLVSSDTEKLQELTVTDTKNISSSKSLSTKLSKTNRLLSLYKAKPARFKRYKNFFQELQGRYTYLFEHLKARFLSKKSFDTLADHLQEVMVESLPTMAEISSQIQKSIDNHIPSQVDALVRSYMSGNILHVQPAQSQTLFVPKQQYQLYLSMKDDPQLQQQDIAIWLALQMKFKGLQGENSAKKRRKLDYEAYVSGESSFGHVNENEQDDDEIPTKQMSQDIMEEVSLTIGEAKLKKMVDEMLRKRCTSGDEHQYHIDQMKNFPLKQTFLYLKKGILGLKDSIESLHKFPAIIFNDDDIEERTSRWVNKCVKKFNPYARYGDLTNEEVKYLKLFEEEIEVRLKYRNQMRTWEMYVNGRPLGP
ncbi:hypothetical protein Tco_0257399 [Tanacetum coccineum]